jgi:hypothetical protein
VSVIRTNAPVVSQQLFVFLGSYYDKEQLNDVMLHRMSKDGMTVKRQVKIRWEAYVVETMFGIICLQVP